MLEHHACVTARCDECGRFYDEDAEGVMHFNTAAEALECITTPYGSDEVAWVVGGDERLRCDLCESRRLCTENGHDWSEWLRCLCQGFDNPCPHRQRLCRCCPAWESTHYAEPKEVTA
ncbi:hypothetical protein AB0L13_20215 [Saccharopolyspora shandongensis]|uniref:hypothetical protein n=1 Tax=Saccharopolyspora shandongensis TaxID=418495 RepID=UPI003440B091